MNTDNLVLEAEHIVRELDDEGRSYRTGEPDRERIADTIFAGVGWPELRGRIHGFCRREYGRCVSKVYVDHDGGAVQTGWVFERKERNEYEDDPKRSAYMHEVWVTLLQPVTCDRGQEHLEPFTFDNTAKGKGVGEEVAL